jgi:hypothetical protein
MVNTISQPSAGHGTELETLQTIPLNSILVLFTYIFSLNKFKHQNSVSISVFLIPSTGTDQCHVLDFNVLTTADDRHNLESSSLYNNLIYLWEEITWPICNRDVLDLCWGRYPIPFFIRLPDFLTCFLRFPILDENADTSPRQTTIVFQILANCKPLSQRIRENVLENRLQV